MRTTGGRTGRVTCSGKASLNRSRKPRARVKTDSVPPSAPCILPPVHEKAIIGWSEYIGFPDWGIDRLKAKIDTGARTSALHVERLEELPGSQVRFEVIHGTRRNPKRKTVTAKALKWARVRSSNGHYQVRCFVRTRIHVGPVVKEIDLSLVSRDKMLFRMLLGRKALEHDFLVNVGKRSLLTARRK